MPELTHDQFLRLIAQQQGLSPEKFGVSANGGVLPTTSILRPTAPVFQPGIVPRTPTFGPPLKGMSLAQGVMPRGQMGYHSPGVNDYVQNGGVIVVGGVHTPADLISNPQYFGARPQPGCQFARQMERRICQDGRRVNLCFDPDHDIAATEAVSRVQLSDNNWCFDTARHCRPDDGSFNIVTERTTLHEGGGGCPA